MFRLRLFLAVLAAPLACTAAEPAASAPMQAPDFRADKLDYDLTTGEATGNGHAALSYRGALLTADEIRYNAKTQIATAVGHVTLTRGAQRILADRAEYHVVDRTFRLWKMRLGEFPLYLSADEVTGGPGEIVATRAMASYHEPTLFGPSLRAEKLRYSQNRTLEAERARVGVGNLPFLPVRRFEQDVRSPLLSYASGTAGYRSSLGAFVELGLHAPVLPGWALGGDVGLYSKRGIMAGPSGSYRFTSDAGPVRGRFRTGYINDTGNRFLDTLGRPIDNQRAFASWEHDQRIGDDLHLFANLNAWSDSEVTRDFRAREFYRLQQPDSFIEADLRQGNGIWSLFTRPQPNHFFRVQQRLPELRFDYLPTALPLGFYQRGSASIARLMQDAFLAEPEKRSTRFDAYYGLDRPWSPTPWLTVNPVAGARITHYTDLDGAQVDRSDTTRTLGELGFDAELRASGTSDYKNEAWHIDGLRHLVTPRLSYRYIPEADRDQRAIPTIDDEVFQTYLAPLGLGDSRTIDRIHATNTVRLGLDNVWQTRDKERGSRDLVALRLAGDVHLQRLGRERNTSDLHSELAVTPAHWLTFSAYQRFDVDAGTVRELNTGFTLRDGQQWRARVSSHYLQGQIEEYVLEGDYRLNEVWRVGTRLHYDARRNRFIEENFGLSQNISNLWHIRYGVSLYNGSSRESRVGFTLSVDLATF
ncbi:LPS-assembly protein LptD [Nibricoccus sp. IMCC34717]|uniref:LPS-assembly protein LptD n=1 Tax=Nibricoccus sp. IMCC34717 TaxID=3034021 RepID=UPI00384B71F9